ncbi:3468_t:CDS:2, partial [Racocetra fulgida]
MEMNVAMVDLQHNLLHRRPDRFNVTDNVKAEIQQNIHRTPADIFRQLEQQNPNLTQKQVHAWWTYFLKKEYEHDYNDQLNSTKILVEENELKMILINNQGIKYLGFITPFFELLKNNNEIVMDATYKTNILGYELYAIIVDTLNDITNLISIDDKNNKSLQLFKQYKSILYDALEIVQKQENANNIQWAQAVQKSFK